MGDRLDADKFRDRELNPDTVIHPSTNRAQRKATSFMWPTPLALSQTATFAQVDDISFVSVGDPTATVSAVELSSYFYVGGIPDDDSEALAFIRKNHLHHVIQRSTT